MRSREGSRVSSWNESESGSLSVKGGLRTGRNRQTRKDLRTLTIRSPSLGRSTGTPEASPTPLSLSKREDEPSELISDYETGPSGTSSSRGVWGFPSVLGVFGDHLRRKSRREVPRDGTGTPQQTFSGRRTECLLWFTRDCTESVSSTQFLTL